MSYGRKRTIPRFVTFLAITVLGASTFWAVPTFAEPDIDEVQARVDELYQQAEIASERYNDARERLRGAEARLDGLRSDLRRQQRRLEDIRGRVVSNVVAQSQGQGLASATQAVLSDDPDGFLEGLVVVSQHNSQLGEMKVELARESRQLEMRQEVLSRELARVRRDEQELAAQKATIDEKAEEAAKLLRRLKAEAAAKAAERAAAAASRDQDRTQPSPEPAPAPPPAASGRAGAAVSYALAQVGDAYVWGAAGPDAFDCSGLTMAAWAQAGVSLPHSSSMQMSAGTPVSSSELQPGDLVFYYSPVSHVGIYIGNGQIVHAANPASGVRTDPVHSMPYSGAVRPG